jgi:diguanylate cyclase (GGDEF)-like protein/hemerythrin-like metal-binding protein
MDHSAPTDEPVRFKPRTKPLLVLVFVAAVISVVGDFMFVSLRDAEKNNQKNQIIAVGKLKANQIESWLADRYSDIQTISEDSYFARDVNKWLLSGKRDAGQRSRIAKRLNAFIEAHHYHSIFLYDAQGQLMLFSGKQIENEEDMTENALMSMQLGHATMIDLHRHFDANLPVGLGFMSALKVDGKLVGAIYFSENPESYLYPLIATWPVPSDSAEVQLVRAEGDQVAFLSKLRQREDPPLTFSLPLSMPELAAAQAVMGKEGVLEHAHDYMGVPVLSFATAIAGTPWVLVSKMSEEEAYTQVNRIERVAVLLAIVFSGVGGAWFWQWWRREEFAQRAAMLELNLRADEALLESETQYHNLFDYASVPILEEDFSRVKAYFLKLAAEGVTDFRAHFELNPNEVKKCATMIKVIAINNRGLEFFGVGSKKELRRHLASHFLDESWPQFTNELIALAEGLTRFEYEVTLRNGLGEKRDLLLNLSVATSNQETLSRVLISFIDITERKQSELRVNFLAYHDRLTALPNRTLFFDRLSQVMSQARRNHKHVALLFLDLDGFKPVNDAHGHEAGDVVLKMTAQRLLACVRAADTVARLGGDEFAVIVGELESPAEIERVAEQILQAFSQTMTLPDGQECKVGVSMGISVYPDNGSEMDILLAAADSAMYDSKRKGKNTYSYFGFGSQQVAVDDTDVWIVFDRSHHVGVVEIDEQHRELVRLVNRLNSAIKNKEDDATTTRLYEELLAFTTFHFATEHRLMEQTGFPDVGAHDLEHRHLEEEAKHYKARLTQGGDLLALQSIKDWLLNHIQNSDKPLAKYLLAHGIR